MQIASPDDLTDLASLGLNLAEGKRLLAGVQREIVAAQARIHAAHRPACPGCGGVCRVKDHRQHGIATLFGQVRVWLPRFRCGGCGALETCVGWPSHGRSTPELHRGRQQPDLVHLTGPEALRHAAERITTQPTCRATSAVTGTHP